MSGERYLLDANAIVSLLRGDQALHQVITFCDYPGWRMYWRA